MSHHHLARRLKSSVGKVGSRRLYLYDFASKLLLMTFFFQLLHSSPGGHNFLISIVSPAKSLSFIALMEEQSISINSPYDERYLQKPVNFFAISSTSSSAHLFSPPLSLALHSLLLFHSPPYLKEDIKVLYPPHISPRRLECPTINASETMH